MQKIIIWCISNFSRGKPIPKFQTIKISVPPMIEHLLRTPIPSLAEDVLWAIGYITDGANEDIDFVMTFQGQELVNKLIQICMSGRTDLETPVTRILGNLVTSTDETTDLVIKSNGLK